MDEIIEYLEKKIQACDELGGMQLEKFAFVVTLKKARKIAMNYTRSCTELLCIDVGDAVWLTNGKKYKMINEEDENYLIEADYNNKNWYSKHKFKVVKKQ